MFHLFHFLNEAAEHERAEIFFGRFRSYMSGNKPLTCGDGCFGIAFDVLTVVL